VDQPSLLTMAFYLLTGLQHEAVVMFFVFSGFLVGGGALSAFQSGRFSFRNYVINRACRISVVFLPALLLTALVNWLGAQLFAGTRFYSEVPLFPSGVGQGWKWDQVACHIVVLQRI
jgi:peptidoglycan/LPS O-acetylase OafA/YrhL